MILLGSPGPDFNTKIILFGSYDMAYTGTKNTLKRRRIPSIDLRELNEDRGKFLMLLYTRKDIHSDDWVGLTIDDEFFKRV